jgi:hypothetical protein
MKCESEFKDTTYGSEIFCKSCGMDIGLNPIKKGNELYCCEGCIKKWKR